MTKTTAAKAAAAQSANVRSMPAQGIRWSAPVLIRRDASGLAVTVPDRVIAALQLGVGDVLNFTELPDGAIEVWMVKKGGYASLEDMGKVAAKPAATARSKARTKTQRGAKQ